MSVCSFALGQTQAPFSCIRMHELGAFLVTKHNGVCQHIPSASGKNFSRIPAQRLEYCLSMVPFGGYVAMAGGTLKISQELQDRIDREHSFAFVP